MSLFPCRWRFRLSGLTLLSGLLGAAVLPAANTAAQESHPADKTVARVEGPSTPAATPSPGILRWNNHESIGGIASEATGTSLTWNTPLFDDPLLLAWHALHRIDWTPPDRAPAEAFSFALRDGSHLYGDLTGVTAEAVAIHSERLGDATLRRGEVLSARRIKGNRLVFAGPWGESGWAPAAANNPSQGQNAAGVPAALGNVPTRLTGPGGALVLPFWRRAFQLSLPLPDRVDVEFRLHAKEQPAFQIVLDSGAAERLSIASWQDDLVLTAANAFEQIRPLGAGDREAALRVCWDRPQGRCQVYTPEGLLLKEWTVPAEKGGPKAGVRLENLGTELTLDFLRVRAWDGQPPPAADLGHPRVELDDGQVVAGSVSRLESGLATISAPGEGPPAAVPLDAVDAVIFSADAPQADPDEMTLTYADGTILRGRMAGIKDDRATLKTSFAEAPLTARTDALRQMWVRVPAPAGSVPEPGLKTLDKIVVRETTLHGRLVAAPGDAWPRWLPVGGERPALPARTLPGEMTRAIAPGADPPAATTLFYTCLGDVLPGVLHGLDRTEMEFESPLVEATKLPAAQVRAIQFDASAQGTVTGFDGPGWQVLKGAGLERRKTGDVLNLPAESALGHSAVMQSEEIRFNYDSENFSALRLRMFCDGVNPARALNYVLFRSGGGMSVGMEETEGQFSTQAQVKVPKGPVAVRLVVDGKGIRCFCNDTLAETVPFPVSRRVGSGLIIEPAGLWGNSVSEVTLSKFSAVAPPGRIFFPDAHADAKAQALLVPRFRKEDPPRHALLAANGDLLRGEIEAITNTQLGFRVGLDLLRVPRDRVKSVIVLPPPADEAAAADENAAVRKLFDRPMDQRIWYGNLKQLVTAMERAVPELKFRLPANFPNQQSQQRLNGPTIGDTLEIVCERFDLRYRIDGDTVILEPKSQPVETEMVSKVYWLKPDARPGKGSARDVLAARGITFPGGASADWQGARQLTMTNTAANQQKLADLLAGEFGGAVGSPDCWLRLTNGGSLAMTVDKFSPDAVTGTEPFYGRCTVPMSEVCTIRNTPPAATPAGSVLDGWRLAYAPEPVLPESGGEGSALLGKPAPAFGLAMLDGSKFDLGQEKGRVVVLDFWATWCGPCIKSLPGLIEAMAQFPPDRVRFVGINQAEAPELIKRFLETRGWKLAVALDAGQNVARQYGVDGIPHTVIIGPDGKVAWVKTGYDPEGEAQAADAVKKLLAAGTGIPDAPVP